MLSKSIQNFVSSVFELFIYPTRKKKKKVRKQTTQFKEQTSRVGNHKQIQNQLMRELPNQEKIKRTRILLWYVLIFIYSQKS